MTCSLNLCKLKYGHSLCEWDCCFALLCLSSWMVAICGRQECGVASYEGGGILGMWSSWPKEFKRFVHLKLIYYRKSIMLRLKKRKTLEILKSVLKKKKKSRSGEDMVRRCVVLCLHYKTPDGKFHMASNLFSFSCLRLVLWPEYVSPPESHVGILMPHVMVWAGGTFGRELGLGAL